MTDQTTEERLRKAIRAALPRAVNFRIPVALPVTRPTWDLIADELARAITLPDGEVITDEHGGRVVYLVVRAGCHDVMAVHSTPPEAFADRELRERGREPGAYEVVAWAVLDAVPSYAELLAEGETR